jgi:hypothetical protein
MESRGFVAVKRDQDGKVTDVVTAFRGSVGSDWGTNGVEKTWGTL